METADSVRQYGVLVPAIARPDPEGGYELVAGHRRHRASELAEKETMPVIVRTWTMMPPPSSWWTAICSGKACSQREGLCLQDEAGGYEATKAHGEI